MASDTKRAISYFIAKVAKPTILPRSNAAYCENGHPRNKQLVSPKLSLRDYNALLGEALAGVKPLTKP